MQRASPERETAGLSGWPSAERRPAAATARDVSPWPEATRVATASCTVISVQISACGRCERSAIESRSRCLRAVGALMLYWRPRVWLLNDGYPAFSSAQVRGLVRASGCNVTAMVRLQGSGGFASGHHGLPINAIPVV